MAYFGDSLAHSALLGIALGFLTGVNATVGILITALLFALLLTLLQQQRRLASDTLLGILSHAALALGMVGLSFAEGARLDLTAYLFGDVLSTSMQDLAWIYGIGLLVLATLGLIWRPLLLVTLHRDLAQAEGIAVLRLDLAYVLLVAVTVAVAMKVVGVLLITAMLMVPAAAARQLARSPEAMALIAVCAAIAASAGGLAASYRWDTPAGPSIVVTALLLFLVSLPLGQFLNTRAAARSRDRGPSALDR